MLKGSAGKQNNNKLKLTNSLGWGAY